MTMLLCTIHFSLRVPVFNRAILLKLRNVPFVILFVQQHNITTSSLAVQVRVHICNRHLLQHTVDVCVE